MDQFKAKKMLVDIILTTEKVMTGKDIYLKKKVVG